MPGIAEQLILSDAAPRLVRGGTGLAYRVLDCTKIDGVPGSAMEGPAEIRVGACQTQPQHMDEVERGNCMAQ